MPSNANTEATPIPMNRKDSPPSSGDEDSQDGHWYDGHWYPLSFAEAKLKDRAFLENKTIHIILRKKNIMLDHIFPFVGVGHYIFVALVNRAMRDRYKQYVTRLMAENDNLPLVVPSGCGYWKSTRSAAISDTFFSAAFGSLSCAMFWDKKAKKDKKDGGHYIGRHQACKAAAQIGSLPMLQWARKKKFPWDCGTCYMAAKNGHIEILKWAFKNGCPSWTYDSTKSVCAGAAEGGHLEILKYAREHGCPWNSYTCAFAAMNGHLEIVQWAHEHDCPWDASTCHLAFSRGHRHILNYAKENGCPGADAERFNLD